MRQLQFPKDAVLALDGTHVTDHNRSALSVSYERIEETLRTQNGTLRKYHRADKRSLSCSWTNVPENDTHTVDSGMGVEELEAFYLATPGVFTVTITYDMELAGNQASLVPVTDTLQMVFDSFSKTLESRQGDVNLYNMRLSLQEV